MITYRKRVFKHPTTRAERKWFKGTGLLSMRRNISLGDYTYMNHMGNFALYEHTKFGIEKHEINVFQYPQAVQDTIDKMIKEHKPVNHIIDYLDFLQL